MSGSVSTASSPKPLLFIAGDIGGTKANLAVFQAVESAVGHELIRIRQGRYPSAAYPGLNAILREFLGTDTYYISGACFGVPGPVKNGRVKPTNLSWAVDAAEIHEEFGFNSVHVINDLLANAHGISELHGADFETLNPGIAENVGNRAVISPGTGLGQAGLFFDGESYLPWACEGGHTDFAPRNEGEIALLQFLMKEFGRVSYERILCGQGIENVYRFLRETGRCAPTPSVEAEIKNGDAAAVISGHGLKGDCALCMQTLEMFVQILGAEAGNLALKTMALGGVYIGGGIPAKILPKLRTTQFMNAFTDKGRLSAVMEGIPVHVVLNDDAALLGAAHCAYIGNRKLR